MTLSFGQTILRDSPRGGKSVYLLGKNKCCGLKVVL